MAFLIYPYSAQVILLMPTTSLGPMFDTLVHAGLGLRVFQAFARSIQPPKEGAMGLYRFFFGFVQALADNKDREAEVKPAQKYAEARLPPPTILPPTL